MKKKIVKFLRFLNSIFLEIILTVVGIFSWQQTNDIGNKWVSKVADGKHSVLKNLEDIKTMVGGASVHTSSGFDGGSLAMGLITCMCIYGIVWLQIKKTKP